MKLKSVPGSESDPGPLAIRQCDFAIGVTGLLAMALGLVALCQSDLGLMAPLSSGIVMTVLIATGIAVLVSFVISETQARRGQVHAVMGYVFLVPVFSAARANPSEVAVGIGSVSMVSLTAYLGAGLRIRAPLAKQAVLLELVLATVALSAQSATVTVALAILSAILCAGAHLKMSQLERRAMSS